MTHKIAVVWAEIVPAARLAEAYKAVEKATAITAVIDATWLCPTKMPSAVADPIISPLVAMVRTRA